MDENCEVWVPYSDAQKERVRLSEALKGWWKLAHPIRAWHLYAALLCSLWVAAEKSGYRVRENRAFKSPADQDPWFCTLEVTAENAGNVESVLSMWQQRRNTYDDLFHMVEECELDAMRQPVRRWIDQLESWGR